MGSCITAPQFWAECSLQAHRPDDLVAEEPPAGMAWHRCASRKLFPDTLVSHIEQCILTVAYSRRIAALTEQCYLTVAGLQRILVSQSRTASSKSAVDIIKI